jgi:pilus assembly protein Flp/PilA
MSENLTQLLLKLQQVRRGQAMVEYALILALVSIVAIAMLNLIGTDVNLVFNNVANRLGAAI